MNKSPNPSWTARGGGPFVGTVRFPGDKSVSHRAIILGSLADGPLTVRGLSRGEDVMCTLRAFQKMGVSSRFKAPDDLIIRGVGLSGLAEPSDLLDLGNSGTSARLLTGLLAGQGFFSVLSGDASLRRRPMARVVDPLRRMGAQIDGRDDGRLLPLAIHGTDLRGIRYELPVASAQVKSAMLLSGLFAEGGVVVVEKAPTRDHTERMLDYLGADIAAEGAEIRVSGAQPLAARDLYVPGDLSGAAFFLVAASIAPGSDLVLEGVGVNPGRTGVLDALSAMGADIELTNQRTWSGEPVADIRVRSATLSGIDVPPEWVPSLVDEVPVLAVAAACAEGTTRFTGATELRVKESDRIAAIARMLTAAGVTVREADDGLEIDGAPALSACDVDSEGDHRIAMAMAVASLRATGPIEIGDVGCVRTSFPGFADRFRAAGGLLKTHDAWPGMRTSES